jgi:hypothetical protein
MDNLPIAKILQIKNNSTVVDCPFCFKLHIHGKIDKPEVRTSHCHKGDYLIKFY